MDVKKWTLSFALVAMRGLIILYYNIYIYMFVCTH